MDQDTSDARLNLKPTAAQRIAQGRLSRFIMPSKKFVALAPLLHVFPEKVRLRILFLVKQKRLLNLESPRSFNEKVQWRKLHERREDFAIFADKLRVKELVSRKAPAVLVPKVYRSGDRLADLRLEEMSPPYVIKANHASGTNWIVKDSCSVPKNVELLERRWRSLRLSQTFVEWAYSQVPIRFFVEEYLSFTDSVPIDFKIWVFHGRAEFIQVDTDRFSGHKRAFFDRNWQKQPFLLTFPDTDGQVEKPRNLMKMLSVAEQIADNLDFARVDLYTTHESIYFGEVTLYPDAGHGMFRPSEYDYFVGGFWILPTSN